MSVNIAVLVPFLEELPLLRASSKDRGVPRGRLLLIGRLLLLGLGVGLVLGRVWLLGAGLVLGGGVCLRWEWLLLVDDARALLLRGVLLLLGAIPRLLLSCTTSYTHNL